MLDFNIISNINLILEIILTNDFFLGLPNKVFFKNNLQPLYFTGYIMHLLHPTIGWLGNSEINI